MVIVGGLHRGVSSRQATVTEDSAFAAACTYARAEPAGAATVSGANERLDHALP